MKSIIKDSLILFAITLVAGLLLAVVNELTKGPIAEAAIKQKEDACKAVFESASSFEEYSDLAIDMPDGSKVIIDEVYKAMDASGSLLGYVINVTSKEGYGGDISFSMGVTLDRHLNGISILKSSETVGLGLEAENVLVPQFRDKDVVSFTYTKVGSTNDSEIDAISSATITTNAFVNAVNGGLSFFDSSLCEGGVN